ncbi:WxL domain-containing protein [Texcoconibacillus texcoconensis]|uniref:WxL domain-containing protein n=1 Tax=Texcoconibacillus texcoconensis TaxID=1095777 RepID=A0A840QSZ7_9BACI|nr:WxL domain-containing protein [Texcoconibacillus texcoconensis]MBB5174656.1 hypothetical protein [Texcoconibacillus texcoconensis]
MDFYNHEVIRTNSGEKLVILYIDPSSFQTEFAHEYLDDREGMPNVIQEKAYHYVRKHLPHLRGNTIKVMMGSLLIANILGSTLSPSTTFAEEYGEDQSTEHVEANSLLEDIWDTVTDDIDDGDDSEQLNESDSQEHLNEETTPSHESDEVLPPGHHDEGVLPPGHEDEDEGEDELPPGHEDEGVLPPGHQDEDFSLPEEVEENHPFYMGKLEIGEFNSIVLNGEVQHIKANINAIPIENPSIEDGWSVMIKAPPLTNENGHQLPQGSLKIQKPNLSNQSSDASIEGVSVSGGEIDTSRGLKVASANHGRGVGSYLVSFPHDALNLTLEPKNIYAGTYSTTITAEIAIGP